MHAHSLHKLGEACCQRTFTHARALLAGEEFRHMHAIRATETGENDHTTVKLFKSCQPGNGKAAFEIQSAKVA